MTNAQKDDFLKQFLKTFEKAKQMSELERTGYFMYQFPQFLDQVWQDGYFAGRIEMEREMFEKLN